MRKKHLINYFEEFDEKTALEQAKKCLLYTLECEITECLKELFLRKSIRTFKISQNGKTLDFVTKDIDENCFNTYTFSIRHIDLSDYFNYSILVNKCKAVMNEEQLRQFLDHVQYHVTSHDFYFYDSDKYYSDWIQYNFEQLFVNVINEYSHEIARHIVEKEVSRVIIDQLLNGTLAKWRSTQDPAKLRVKDELHELRNRHEKLSSFMNSEQFNKLDNTAKKLLSQQYQIMYSYIQVLEERLKCWRTLK